MSDEKPMGQVIQIDEGRIRDHLGELVRGTVEETLNAMLDAEADQLCGAARYERSEARQDTRAGSYERTLQTSAGEVNLKVPKLRRQTFETTIIERYRRRESSVEEALIEMYLAGISVLRVEDIHEALWGTRVSPSTVSNLNQKIYAKIEAWRNRRIEGEHPYLYLDGIVMKRSWAGEVRNVSLLVASAVNSEGFREILGRDGSRDGRGDPQRVAGCRSGSALRCRTLRTHSRPAGHPGRQLRTVAAHGSGRSKPQGSEAATPDLRNGHHRALPPARELGRGSADRDVSGWDFGPPGRGHHRGAVGHPCHPEYGVEPEPEDLRQDRGLAEPADRG